MDLQVTCIKKHPRTDTHEGITELGGYGWRYSRSQVIDYIEARVHSFYTMVLYWFSVNKTAGGKSNRDTGWL